MRYHIITNFIEYFIIISIFIENGVESNLFLAFCVK